MSISVPRGQYHLPTTWKEDNLRVENYDPETYKCVFREYPKGNLLEGRVIIKNWNPIKLLGDTTTERIEDGDAATGRQGEQRAAPQRTLRPARRQHQDGR